MGQGWPSVAVQMSGAQTCSPPSNSGFNFLPSSEPLPVNRLQPRILEDTKIEDVYKNKKFSLICFWKLRRNLIN